MQNQVTSIELHSDRHAVKATVKERIVKGEYQVIFISPEALGGIEWRGMLSTFTYRKCLKGFVIDEAQCIKKWYVQVHSKLSLAVIIMYCRGESFRKEFTYLGEIIPANVNVMALTATAISPLESTS